MTEDDTFLALKRTPYETLWPLVKEFLIKTRLTKTPDLIRFVEGHGWDFDEFSNKLCKS